MEEKELCRACDGPPCRFLVFSRKDLFVPFGFSEVFGLGSRERRTESRGLKVSVLFLFFQLKSEKKMIRGMCRVSDK